MKRRILMGLSVLVCCFSLMGCSSDKEETDMNYAVESTGYTFEDLSKYSFCFMSGAGGWSTDFEIEKDGSFHGMYHDSDMGVTGEGYENGTRYMSVFNGKFTNLRKVNEYCYEMDLESVAYENALGTEEIIDNVLYVYTDWYGLEGTDTYKIYLPGTPTTEFSEEVCTWLGAIDEVGETLERPAIVNEPMQYGIYSYNRLSAVEEAQMTYDSYKASYDYYIEMAQQTTTTLEMSDNAMALYNVADDCLNELWTILKYNVEEEQFQVILEEQRAWIPTKEEAANAILEEAGGGSAAPVDARATMADMTMERCAVLLEYIKEYAWE